MFDLDHFKKVNDTYGHLGGDAVLCNVARVVRSSLRENDIAGRYGGEEFGIILPNTPEAGAMIVADRIRASIEASPIPFEEREIKATSSLGVAEYRPGVADCEELIAQADAALYRAKEGGRNRVILHSTMSGVA
jgi:diguanylate cyclase (GGDEF)-like protein